MDFLDGKWASRYFNVLSDRWSCYVSGGFDEMESRMEQLLTIIFGIILIIVVIWIIYAGGSEKICEWAGLPLPNWP
jgi:hypothetical protein